MDRCQYPLTYCHKAFKLPTSGKWVTREFMSAAFHRNDEVENITGVDGKPSLEFRWNSAITFASTCYPVAPRGYAGYKSGTLQQYLKEVHPGTKLPYALYKVSDRRQGKGGNSETVQHTQFVETTEHLTRKIDYNKLNKFVQRKLPVAEGETDSDDDGESESVHSGEV